MILVSACLVGCKCRYNGKSTLVQDLKDLFEQGFLFPVCPEIMGGLPIPRPAANIDGFSGYDVLNNSAKVIDQNNKDVTKCFLDGAQKCANISSTLKIKEAILKSKSPSCGINTTSTINGVVQAPGVSAALLVKMGIKVYDETTYLNRTIYGL